MDKTIRATNNQSNDAIQKTIRGNVAPNVLANQMDKTVQGQLLEKTKRANDNQSNIKENLTETKTFILDNLLYNVKELICSNTGEALIFLVENQNKEYVLKLYYTNCNLPDSYIMDTVCKSKDTQLIVATYSYGKWLNKDNGISHDYELMEYCSGGTLENYSLDENDDQLIGELALRCAISLDFIHKKQIIHRDIKPSNFFFRKSSRDIEDITLADFGIAVKADENGEILVKYQDRTPIYSAPEFYFTVDGEMKLSYKSDFFSLGIILINLIDNKLISNVNEYKLIDLKRTGTLPYPKNISNHVLQLLKALTDPNPETRASLPEIVKWCKGEDIYNLNIENGNKNFHILFNGSKKQIAHSPAELGQLMYDNQDLAIDYLYNGNIEKWLTENESPELAVIIQNIVEKDYPKDYKQGLTAACYYLNNTIPYLDINGESLTTSEEIATSLEENSDHYSEALKNETNELYSFFDAHSIDKKKTLALKFVPLFNGNKDDALRQLIYTLDPSKPWIFSTLDDKKISCNDIEDIIKCIENNNLTKESWYDICSESFLQWIGIRNPAVEGLIRSTDGHEDNPYCVIYNLSPDISFEYTLDKKSKLYFFTVEDVALYLNYNLSEYENDKNDEYSKSIIENLYDIEGSRLYYYLKSKMKYDDKIEWIKYCMNLGSKENSSKYGPYNSTIGAYKTIKGMGQNPYYYFPKTDQFVYNLDDLKKIPKKDIVESLENKNLADWITIFFQEDSSVDLSEKYTYEKLTVKYLEFIKELDPNYKYLKYYMDANDYVDYIASVLKKETNKNRYSKVFIGVTILILAAWLINYLINNSFLLNTNGSWPLWTAAVAGLFVGLRSLFYTFNNFIVSFLKAVGTFALTLFLLAATVSYPFYTASIIIGAYIVYVIVTSYFKKIRKGVKNASLLYHPSFEERNLEPLHYAYKISNGKKKFESSIEDQSVNLAYEYKINTKMFLIKTIPLMIILIGSIIAVNKYDIPQLATEMNSNNEQTEMIIGNYIGNFGNNKAELEIISDKNNEVDAVMKVKFKNETHEELKGTVNIKDKTFKFDDVNSNGILDGNYTGTFDDSYKTITGVYKNYKTNKVVDFKMNK